MYKYWINAGKADEIYASGVLTGISCQEGYETIREDHD